MPKPISPHPWSPKPEIINSGERNSLGVTIPDAAYWRIAVVYTDGDPGTITTSASATAPIEAQLGQGTPQFQGMAYNFAPANSGSFTFDWLNAASSGGYIAVTPMGPGATALPEKVLDNTAIIGFSNMDNQTWPSVTPTAPGQTVLCFYGYHDNAGGPTSEAFLDAASYAGATWGGHNSFSTITGNDASVGYHAFYDPPVGVAFAPATNAASTGQAGMMFTVLLDSYQLDEPQFLGGAGVYYNGVQTGNWPMPSKATVDALGTQPGDIFFLANLSTLGRYTTFGNASWLDAQFGGASLPDTCFGYVRLDENGYQQAWVDDPPTFSYQVSSPTSVQCWGVIRGVQQTGTYFSLSNYAYRGTTTTSWTNMPAHGNAGEFVVCMFAANISNAGFSSLNNYLYQELFGSYGAIAVVPEGRWTPGTPGTGINSSWSTSRNPEMVSLSFLAAAPTSFVEGMEVSAPAVVSATLTSTPGAQFIQSAISATATIDLNITSTQRRRSSPRLEFVYIRGLDGDMKGVLV